MVDNVNVLDLVVLTKCIDFTLRNQYLGMANLAPNKLLLDIGDNNINNIILLG